MKTTFSGGGLHFVFRSKYTEKIIACNHRRRENKTRIILIAKVCFYNFDKSKVLAPVSPNETPGRPCAYGAAGIHLLCPMLIYSVTVSDRIARALAVAVTIPMHEDIRALNQGGVGIEEP